MALRDPFNAKLLDIILGSMFYPTVFSAEFKQQNYTV